MQRFLFAPVFLLCAALFVLAPSVAPASPEQPESAPDFSLPDASGAMHRLSDFRGKVVILNFWASWCNECVAEIPSLNALSAELKDKGLVVIGISIDRNWEDVADVTTKIDYRVLLDKKGDVFVHKFTITRLPATIIIDREGLLVEKAVGSRDFNTEAYTEKIRKLLQKKASL